MTNPRKPCSSAIRFFLLLSLGLSIAPQAHSAVITEWDFSVRTYFSGANLFSAGGGTILENETQVSTGGTQTPVTPLIGLGSVFDNTLPLATSRTGITLSTNGADPVQDQGIAAPPVTGSVLTDNLVPTAASFITHHNTPTSTRFAALERSPLKVELSLTQSSPPGPGASDSLVLDIPIFVFYTLNTDPCLVVSPTPCNDIFAMPASASFNSPFEVDGVSYFASMFPVIDGAAGAFDPLPSEVCGAAGIAESCVGFTTPERQDTTFQLGFIVTSDTIPIPEVETLLFLLAGLVGMGIRQAYGRSRSPEATA